MDLANVNNNDSTIAAKASLLCLPNEILAEIFGKLSMKDRQTLGSINDRLSAIAKRTGCRDFSTVCFSTIESPEIIAWDSSANKIRKAPSDDCLAEFFRRSTCRSLVIEGKLSEEHEKSITAAFKSLDFQQLRADFKGDYSGRILIDLLRGKSGIEELHIGGQRWDGEVEEARNVLMTTPAVRRLTIAASSLNLLNDDVFTHLVSVSHYTDLSGIEATTITSSGLERAFETVSQSPFFKQVSCLVPASTLNKFLHLRRSQFEVVFRTNLQHIETATHFDYRFPRFADQSEGFAFVSIRSDKKPVPC